MNKTMTPAEYLARKEKMKEEKRLGFIPEYETIKDELRDTGYRRHSFQLKVHNCWPEVQEKLDAIDHRLSYIRGILPELTGDNRYVFKFREISEPTQTLERRGIDPDRLRHPLPSRLGYKSYQLVFALKDEPLIAELENIFRRNVDGIMYSIRKEFGTTIFLRDLSELFTFCIWVDILDGCLPKEDIGALYENRLRHHFFADDYSNNIRPAYVYKFNMNPEWYPYSDYLSKLSLRGDVPTFIYWLIRKDMNRDADVPYPKAKRNRNRKSPKRKSVAGVTLTLTPGEDDDVKEWIDNKLWLKVYQKDWRWIRPNTRWKSVADEVRCTQPKDWEADMEDETTKAVVKKVYKRNHYTGLAFYVATLVEDYYHDNK